MVTILKTATRNERVSLIASTIPTMSKKDNPYHGRIIQITSAVGTINWSYQDAVNEQRVKEGKMPDFVADERKWGTKVGVFIEHNNRLYLEVKIEKYSEIKYFDIEGVEISRDLVEQFFPVRKPSKTQNLYDEIVLRDYEIGNIRSITFQGQTYDIKE